MIIVDSDVLIAHLRGVEAARNWLLEAREATGPIALSVASVVEITGGMRSDERQDVRRLIGSLRVEEATEPIGRRAGELMRRYRRSHPGIGLGDYLVAATAEVGGLELATLNVRHFPMFEDLQPPFRLAC